MYIVDVSGDQINLKNKWNIALLEEDIEKYLCHIKIPVLLGLGYSRLGSGLGYSQSFVAISFSYGEIILLVAPMSMMRLDVLKI